jgi:hypothetical protein
MYWWRRGAYRVLVGRSEGKIPLGRPRRRWEDNIKRILRNWIGDHGLNWSGLEHGEMAGFVNAVMNRQVQ